MHITSLKGVHKMKMYVTPDMAKKTPICFTQRVTIPWWYLMFQRP